MYIKNLKIIIENFVEDLNYRKIVLYVGNVDSSKLYSKLKRDDIGHLNRFDSITFNNLMYIENCDLQDVDTIYGNEFGNSLLYLIEEGYTVYSLQYDSTIDRYFIDMNF